MLLFLKNITVGVAALGVVAVGGISATLSNASSAPIATPVIAATQAPATAPDQELIETRDQLAVDRAADRLVDPQLISLEAGDRRDRLTTSAAQITAQRKAIQKKLKAEAKARAERFKELGYDPSVTDPREIARQMAQNKYGWGETQFSCYDNIIIRESNWRWNADNPTSSAYGIPQALPGRKMASAGADWLTNPATQIKWGLGYVKERFGTPCAAWAFKRAHGWY
ncbi:MAG: hypothetical protein WAS07_14510 [Micropruina sp.]